MYKYVYTGERPITTKSGTAIATDFTRIVHGGRGAYIEFTIEQIFFMVLKRIHLHHYYYDEFVIDDIVKVYFQIHTVDYADYRVGYYYISPIYLKGFERDGKYTFINNEYKEIAHDTRKTTG